MAERLHPFCPGLLNEEESVDGEKRKDRGRGRPARGVAVNDVPELGLTAHRPLRRRQEAGVHHGVAGPDVTAELTLQGVETGGKQARLTHYRIDDRPSNAYTAWQEMGSPPKPSAQQREALQKASELGKLEEPRTVELRGGELVLRLTMPRQSV